MSLRFSTLLLLGGLAWMIKPLNAVASVDWNLSSRLESMNADTNISSRFLVQTDLSVKLTQLNFYVDAFAEADGAPEKSLEWRRFEDNAYLREGYGEFVSDWVFLKIGRQSARWSESWIVPSLDVWTARRYERLFWEPLSYQLAHSTGAILTLARDKWSLDMAVMWDIQRNSFPKPYPRHVELNQSKSLNSGARFKFDFNGLQSTFILAQALDKQTAGWAASYAFEKFVPKIEIGTTINDQDDPYIINRNMNFGTLGFDIFIDQWTLTPQVTAFENEDPYNVTEPQAVYYVALQYDSRFHGFQFQGFANSVYKDTFVSAEYTYKFTNSWSLSFTAQNYFGQGTALTSSVYDLTGGVFLGVRLQYNRSLF